MSRKTMGWIAIAFLVLATTIPAAAQMKKADPPIDQTVPLRPDLVVTSIDFKDFRLFTDANGVKKGTVTPSVTYKNQGRASSGTFELAWEYFDYSSNTWNFWLQTGLTNNLQAGQSFTHGGQPADSFIWVIGPNWPKFRCRLDIRNAVTESNESNNAKEKTFRVMLPTR